MNPDSPVPSTYSDRLQQVIAEYLQEVDAGRAPDPEDYLRRYPDLAGELRSFFAIQKAIAELARVEAPSTISGLAAGAELDTTDLAAPVADKSRNQPRSFGDYELLEKIARGGMGVVYRAWQRSANRKVALKMILAGEFADEAQVLRFRQEAEAAANLDHPNIVRSTRSATGARRTWIPRCPSTA